ncbi:hypothetical protein [Lacinutrix salivirga]
MKKTLFLICIIFFVSCKTENRFNKIQENPITQNNPKKQRKLFDSLPFGNPKLKSYPFKKNTWIDDLNNKDLQDATIFLYEDDYKKFKNIKKQGLKTLPSKNKYFLLNNKELNTTEQYNSNGNLYLLFENISYRLCYLEVEITDIENNLFENQKGGFLITLDNNDNIIDKKKFNQNLYNTKESTERWNFSNLKLSYIDKEKVITTYTFLCKEWDLNYEFKLINTIKYKINNNGLFLKL